MNARHVILALTLAVSISVAFAQKPGPRPAPAYQHRVDSVRQIPGLVAFWDFVQREDGPGGSGRFIAHTADGERHRYMLEPHNISRDFWHDGPAATLADFPLLGRGPFGQAVQFRAPTAQNDLPVLLVPRAALHDTPLDVKGPGKSVSMVVWLIYEEGGHAIAGLWHEGTDSPPKGMPAMVLERGRRHYGLFAGLGANEGAASVHVSENGRATFGDTYARHLAVTPEKMKRVNPGATTEETDSGWSVAGFVYDNEKKSITAYLDGVATEHWIENPASDGFYQFAEQAWRQARLAKLPGAQPGEDPGFPRDQFYEPPENTLLNDMVESETAEQRVVLRTYEFTKVRVTLRKDARGAYTEESAVELAALKANPYWFGHDLYAPRTPEEGGPFTVGRVIHSNRHATLSAWLGGVAVYGRALAPEQMQTLARIGRTSSAPDPAAPILHLRDVLKTPPTDEQPRLPEAAMVP